MKKVAVLCIALVVLALRCGGEGKEQKEGCSITALPGDLVITEAMVNPNGADEGKEWIEIYNASSVDQCLNGMLIVVQGTTRSSQAYVMSTQDIILKPGEYAVLGSGQLPFLTYSWGDSLMPLPNETGSIAIYAGSDRLDYIGYGQVEEPNVPEPQEGKTLALCGECKSSDCNDDPSNWTYGKDSYDEDENLGTPGGPNPECACKPPEGYDNLAQPKPGDLTITEVFANPDGSDDKKKEWFEVKVNASQPLNLAGLGIATKQGEEPKYVIDETGCVVVEPGAYVVFAGSDDPAQNGGIENAISYNAKFSLRNKDGYIGLIYNGQLIAEVSYKDAPSGASLQLDEQSGQWCQAQVPYGDGTAKGTPGQPNWSCSVVVCMQNGQPIEAHTPKPGDLVINEIFCNTPGSEKKEAEWIELYVAASEPIHLNGLELWFDPDADKPAAVVEPEGNQCLQVMPGSYVVLAQSNDQSKNGIPPDKVTYVYSGSAMKNEGYLAIKVAGTIIDEVYYPEAEDGKSVQKDSKGNWCSAKLPYWNTDWGDTAYGTPGAMNSECDAAYCLDNGQWRIVQPPSTGDLVITEYFGNIPGSDDPAKEWFEFYVTPQASGKDLNGVSVVINDKVQHTFGEDNPNCITLETGYYVVANSTNPDQNGGIENVDLSYPLTLPNSNVILTLQYQDKVVDSVTFESAPEGASLQLDPGHLDAISNDVAGYWCEAKTVYGNMGYFGTPGAENVPCSAQFCTTQDGSSKELRPPKVGDIVITEVYANPPGQDDPDYEWFEVYVKPDAGEVDLNGVSIMVDVGVEPEFTFNVAECITLQPGNYYVLCRSKGVYEGEAFANCIEYSSVTLKQSSATLALGSAGELIDLVPFYGPTTEGVSRSLDPSHIDADENDNSDYWCDTPEGFEFAPGLRGTPGQENPPCSD